MKVQQYIELLKLRGVTKLDKGQSVADAVKNTGGNPTDSEMRIVNEIIINDLYEKIMKLENDYEIKMKILNNNISNLEVKLKESEKYSDWVYCLEVAGYDNWDGIEYASDIWKEQDEKGNSFQKIYGDRPY